jgi:DNA-damage-inducible protein D
MTHDHAVVPTSMHRGFEAIKKIGEDGFEYWEARELMPLLEYRNWQDFHAAIKRAMITCKGSGQDLPEHFRDVPKVLIVAKDRPNRTIRKIVDYYLSRFACYLIAQNGDPRKPAIAFAQTYFAVQTRRQELFESLDAPGRRLYVRQEVIHHNKKLFDTAKGAGVSDFGKFNNAGYLGLYGLTAEDIKKHKDIGEDDILDRAGATELAANLFRITQTDDKIRKDDVQGADAADATHFTVGRKVRQSITDIGGTMPEELPVEEHIKKLVRREVGQLPKAGKKISTRRGNKAKK